MYRSKKFLNWSLNQGTKFMGMGDPVWHHVKFLRNGGTAINPPDTEIIIIPDSLHKIIGNKGEPSAFLSAGWSLDDVAKEIESNISEFLESKNVDSTKLKIRAMTRYMEENKL